MRHYSYVGNMGVISVDEAEVRSSLGALSRQFESLGLVVQETVVGRDDAKVLGAILDGRRLQTRVSRRRALRLSAGLAGLLQLCTATGSMYEDVLGHATFAGLVWRPVIS